MALFNYTPLDMELGVQRQDADAHFWRQLSVYATLRSGDLKESHRSLSDIVSGWRNIDHDAKETLEEESEHVNLSECRDYELKVKGRYSVRYCSWRLLNHSYGKLRFWALGTAQKCQFRPKRMWLWTHPVFQLEKSLKLSNRIFRMSVNHKSNQVFRLSEDGFQKILYAFGNPSSKANASFVWNRYFLLGRRMRHRRVLIKLLGVVGRKNTHGAM